MIQFTVRINPTQRLAKLYLNKGNKIRRMPGVGTLNVVQEQEIIFDTVSNLENG